MTLPARKIRPEKPARTPKRESRWRSPAHTGWLTREFACAMCGSTTNVVAAHVRRGSHTGIGQKPDDWRCVPLCDGPYSGINGTLGCHNIQHGLNMSEPEFWEIYRQLHGQTVEQLIASLIQASPKRREIEAAQQERSKGEVE